MSRSQPPERRLRLTATGDRGRSPEALSQAMERACDCALRAPAVLGIRPWRLEPSTDRLVLRLHPAGQETAIGATERLLRQSAGGGLFMACVVLAAGGWGTHVERVPRPGDPDVLAEIRPVGGLPDPRLAALEPGLQRWRTVRPGSADDPLPEQLLRRLTEIGEGRGILLVPVVRKAHRDLVARLSQDPGGQQGGGPGDGTRPAVDDAGQAPTVLLATRTDDEDAWLRTGEALQHVQLELGRRDRIAVPIPQVIESPLARVQLRAALAWDAHPQLLMRIGSAGPAR